jgi:hypothetical protein
MISRLGQCFTQGKDIKGLDLTHRMDGFDIIGGADSSGKPYTFSDGCGCISMGMAERIAEDFGFDKRNISSCFQVLHYDNLISI